MRYVGKQSIFDDLMIGGVLLTPPDPATYSYELTLPNDDGTAGQFLTTDGNGLLTWTTAAGSGVTMTNGADNRVMTATGATAITGEQYFTFDYSNALGYTTLITADPTKSPSQALRIHMSGAQTTGVHKMLSNFGGKSGVTGSGASYDIKGFANSIRDSATNNANADSYLWGVVNTLIHDNSTGDTKQVGTYNDLDGATTQYGIQNLLTGGTVGTMFGIWQKVDDGAMDLKFVSSDQTTDDYFSIKTGANGATTFTTVDGGNGGADLNANLDFNIDGTVEIATASGKNITLDSGASVYLEGAIIQAEYSTSGVRIRNASASAGYYSQINVAGIDGARIHTLPNATGTLALTSDIPALSVPVTVPQGGTGLTLVASDSILTGNGTSNLVAEPLFKYSADTLLSLGSLSSTAMKIQKNHTLSADGGDLEVIAGSGGAIGFGSGATNKNGGDLILKSGLATGTAESQIKLHATNGMISGTSTSPDLLAVSMQAGQPGDYPFTLKGQIKIHSSNLTSTGGAALDDYMSLYCLYAGQSYIRTEDSQGANNAQLNIIPEGNLYMYTPSGKNMNLDSGDSITLNADNGTITFMDAAAILGRITTNGLDLTDNTGAGVIFEGATDNAHQTTLGVIDPTGTRSINLPDADGTVALGTETTSDDKTFVLKTKKVTITQAQFNSLHTTPIDLIAAPGANKQIVPVSGTFAVDRLTTQANASADLNIHYDLGGGVGSYFLNTYMHIRRFMWNKSTDITYNLAPFSLEIAQSKTVFQNKKLQISVDSILQDGSGTQNCIGDSDIYISYYILDMS